MAYIYDIADTWAASGTTFTGIKLSVTDTASAAGSLLMDLQVGGVSRASVRKDGRMFGNSYYLNSLDGIISGAAAQIMMSLEGAGAFHSFRANQFLVGSNVTLRWSSDFSLTPNTVSAADLILARDAANTLAQRNGVNAQAFNLYNTYTDASNYERGFMRWASNALRIGTEKLGTGAARALEFQTDGTTRLTIATDGIVTATQQVNATNFVATTSVFFGVSGQITSGRIRLSSPADGQALFLNGASNGFDRMMFGGTTSSFPSIKRSTTSLQARLADDSAFTNIQGKLTTEANAVSETITATHTLTLYDAAGTAYKVPCVAA